MHVVIAPDKFKGSLNASQVAEHLAHPMRSAGIQVSTIPMADGGEGTVEAAVSAGLQRVNHRVTGPLGNQIEADYAWDPHRTTAVIEMALASGLMLTEATDDHAKRATSRGTGELIAHALDAGATHIILGVGGSACSDGGAGMLQGLGAHIYDASSRPLPDGGVALQKAAGIDFGHLHPKLSSASVTLAADVDNPLLGPRGAAKVYAPQKGARPDTVQQLENGLARWAELLVEAGWASPEAATDPGAGAAGGVGYAALTVLGARRRPGVEVVLELTHFLERAGQASLVITGEGSLDSQSLHGKTPIGVARAAAEIGVETIAVAGRSKLSHQQVRDAGFIDLYQIVDLAPNTHSAMTQAGAWLSELAQTIITDHLQKRR